MKQIVALFSLLFCLSSFGQIVRIDTLKLQNKNADKIVFPVVRTGDDQTDSLINTGLRYWFIDEDSSISEWIINDLISLDFDVTYNKNGILSLNISAESCAAYCESWKNYYNYSTIIGEPLTIGEIVDSSKDFIALIKKDKAKQFKKQKKELEAMFRDPKTETDSSTYQLALNRYNECESSLSFESFALYETHLEVIDDCVFPHVVRNLTPIINLRYSYSSLKKFLKMNL